MEIIDRLGQIVDIKPESFQFFKTGFIQRTGNEQVLINFIKHPAYTHKIILQFINKDIFFVDMGTLSLLLRFFVGLQVIFYPI